MARKQSIAEYYRAHGRYVRLARVLGCTPRDAQLRMEARVARLRWRATEKRLRALQEPSAPTLARSIKMDEPWMMRDLDK